MVAEFDTEIEKISNQIICLLKSKHHDYGEDNLKKFGLFGIIVRLYDKLSRLENLRESPAKVKETIEDTLIDIAGYAIQAIYLERKSNG